MTVGQCIKCGSIEHADLAMRRNFSQMVRAIWNNQVIAESATFETVEGNVYFPANSIKKEFFKPSDHQTVCGWKGTASYYTIEVNGKQNPNAAWYYATPKDAAKQITNHVAFWKGVQVEK
ncbi:hypothetical protein EDD86DRAFT_203632 [Gorgonomyces haynaldii]|nr:hypothetical protein EDD86DRAFT_203632 [Gorgonomyces haynaldii]